MKHSGQLKWIVAAAAILVLSTLCAACSSGDGSSNQQSGSNLVDTSQSQSSAPSTAATAGRSTPTMGAGSGSLEATATTQPGTPANVRVPNSEVTVNNLTLNLSVQTARRMAVVSSPGATTPQTQQGQNNQTQGGAASQEMVLGAQTQQINKNFDPSQGPPPDPKDGQGDYVRNVTLQVKDKSTGQVVPYLLVSVDILKDGRPVQYDQALLPAVPQGESVEHMHYTNNVVFPGKGRYQLFVRIQPSPVLGNNAPPSTQFEVIVE